jgi:hypothetical protein
LFARKNLRFELDSYFARSLQRENLGVRDAVTPEHTKLL